MKILAFETSCDETAISIIDIKNTGEQNTITILANNIASQVELHKQYGGVFPMMAKREHMKNIGPLYKQALKDANITDIKNEIDYIAVTSGPGLEPALWVGIAFAKELSEKYEIPLVPVDHMEGHLLSSLLPAYKLHEEIVLRDLPSNSISLLVSGGHTEIIKIEENGKYEILGQTVDDASGEAFDKVARMLYLPYPGGPMISSLAKIAREEELRDIVFPRPMLHSGDYNFSFSGLKTAVLYHIRDNPIKDEKEKMQIARAFEDAVVDVLSAKVIKAIHEHGANYLLLGGGVSANTYLREILHTKANKNNFQIYEPLSPLCGDNALMIAIACYFNIKNNKPIPKIEEIKANGNLKISL